MSTIRPVKWLVFAMLCFVLFTQASMLQGAITVSLPNQSADPGASIQVPMNVIDFNNVGAITFKIAYNSAILIWNSVTSNASGVTFTAAANGGVVSIAWVDMSGVTPLNFGSGILLYINFTVIGAAGTSTALDFNSQCELGNNLGDPIAGVSYIDGSVTVLPGLNNPPTVSAVSPNSGEFRSLIVLNATSADPDAGDAVVAEKYEYTIDGGVNWLPIGEDNTPNDSYNWNVSLNVSSVRIRAKAYDGELWSTSWREGTGTFLIDNLAPTTTDDTPAAWQNADFLITLTRNDGTGSGFDATGNTYYSTDVNPPATIGTTIPITVSGIYTIKYYSVDDVGNTESPKTAANQARLDKEVPTFSNWTMTPPDVNTATTGSITITVSVNDALSGVSGAPGLDYRYSSTSYNGYETMTFVSGNTWSFNIPEPPGGWSSYGAETLFYKVQASDVAGNTGTSERSELIEPISPGDQGFTDATSSSGLPANIYGNGVAWGDYDKDGHIDLLLGTNGVGDNSSPFKPKLYHNDGSGHFSDVTTLHDLASLPGSAGSFNFIDFDRDGDLDIYTAGSGLSAVNYTQALFRNDAGTYHNITEAANLIDAAVGVESSAWGDFNNDGWIDLFVSKQNGQRCLLYQNNGNSTFTEISATIGLNITEMACMPVVFDYDKDGDVDIFFTNNHYYNKLYRNNYVPDGTLSFTNSTSTAQLNGAYQDLGIDVGDYNNDLYPDIVISGGSEEVQHELFENNGSAIFTNKAAEKGITGTHGRGIFWIDYDGDKDQDLFINHWGGESSQFFENSSGVFTDMAASLGVAGNLDGTGCAYADYNNDGFVDFFAQSANDDYSSGRLFRNNGHTNNWITLKLTGVQSNTDAIGARVELLSGGLWQMRLIIAGSSMFSQNALEAYFGLGTSGSVDSIKVYWPSGIVQKLASIASNQNLSITEPSANHPPIVTAIIPIGGSFSNPIALSAVYSDPDPGDAVEKITYQYSLDGLSSWIDITEDATPADGYSWSSTLSNTEIYLRARAYDGALWGDWYTNAAMVKINPSVPWDYVNTGKTAIIGVQTSINPTIDGQPLQAGDVIGVFFVRNGALACGGYETWLGTQNISIAAFGDDDQTTLKDGFAENELFQYKIWDASAGREYTATVTYQSGSSNYTTNGICILSSLQAVSSVTHALNLPAGWSMISSYVVPANSALNDLMNGIVSNLTILKNGAGQVYWPALSINTIGNWNYRAGYQINLKNPDTLAITGLPAIPEITPLALAQGWNMIGYLRNSNQSVVTALASAVSSMVIAKNGSGKVYWPALSINTIINMIPGEGYQLYMSQAATLTYPANSLGKEAVASASNSWAPRHYQASYCNSGHTAVIGIVSAALQDGDEVSAWDRGGRLLSAGAISGGRTVLVLAGDDPLSEGVKEGPAENEVIYLKIWRKSDGQEIPGEGWTVEDGLTGLTLGAPLLYKSDAVCLLRAAPVELSLVSDYRLEQNYPNPFNPETAIRFELPRTGRVRLAIMNLQGQVMRTLVDEERAAGSHTLIWDGRDDNGQPAATGIYLVRLQAGEYVRTMKMSFIK